MLVQRQGAGDGARCMVRLLAGSAEQHVERVADDLCHCAIVSKHDVGHAGEVFIEQRAQHFRFKRLDECSETCDVGKQRGDLAALTSEIERGGVAGKLLRQIRRKLP